MANNHLFIKSGFLSVPLQNGVGRYVCQLMRITLKFCKSHGGSRGAREFIECDLVEFARNHPNIAVYVKPRRHRSSVVVAEYLNGDRVWKSLHNQSREEINKWIHLLRTQSGDVSALRLRKNMHTDYPSIQGPWNPFLFKDHALNLAKLPDPKWGCNNRLSKTATEVLREMFEKQKLSEKSIDQLESKRAE